MNTSTPGLEKANSYAFQTRIQPSWPLVSFESLTVISSIIVTPFLRIIGSRHSDINLNLFWQKKILWQQNFVPRFSLFCYVYPKWAISFQTQVFLYGNSPNPLFFNLGPPFFQDWLIFSQPAFLKRPLYFRGKPSPFFLPSNVFPDIGSVGQVEKKNHKESWDSRPWYPRTTLKVNIHIFGLTKCTISWEKCSCFCSCFSLCNYYAHFSD